MRTIIKKASKWAREDNSSVHSDPDPLDKPAFEKLSGIHIWSDTTIGSVGCQFGSGGVPNQVSLGMYWMKQMKQFWFDLQRT